MLQCQAEIQGEIHVRSSLCSGALAPMRRYCNGGMFNSGLNSVQVSPASQSLTVGQTAQFSAVGTYGNAKKLTTGDITSTVTWASSVPSVATINSSGVATAVGPGTTVISASATAFNGHVSSSANVTVTGSSSGSSGGLIASLAIMPGAQAVAAPAQNQPVYSDRDNCSRNDSEPDNQVTWSSSSTQIATISPASGLATAVGRGSITTITALYTNSPGGTVASGSATLP